MLCKPLHEVVHYAAACESTFTALGWQSALQNDNHLPLCAYLWERTEKNMIFSVLVKKPHDERNLRAARSPAQQQGLSTADPSFIWREACVLNTNLERVTMHWNIPKRKERGYQENICIAVSSSGHNVR